MHNPVAIAILPEAENRTSRAGEEGAIIDAITAAQGTVVPVADANALIWLSVGGSEELAGVLAAHPNITWVQLPWAGVDAFNMSHLADFHGTVTCAKGAYAPMVAEHALMLTIGVLHNITQHARTLRWRVTQPRTLEGRNVTVLGGGGIATEYLAMLKPFRCRTTAIRRHADVPVDGAAATSSLDQLISLAKNTDVLVVALALTPETRHVVNTEVLSALPPHAIVINVGRGAHIDTDALTTALLNGTLAGAGLDVTDPEPLPAEHPLWTLENVLITSHCADSDGYVTEQLSRRIAHNIRAIQSGESLKGIVDITSGY